MDQLSVEEVLCAHCETIVKEEQKYCVSCGYPQGGTAGEKSKFHSDRIIAKSKVDEAPRVLRNARNVLFAMAVINLLYGVFLFFSNGDSATLIAGVIVAIIYVILAFWSQQKPLISMVLALLLYLTLIVVGGIVDPATIYKGFILKGAIIFFLGKGINSALHLRNLDKPK